MIVTCPRCFRADDVSYQRLPDHMLVYVCSGAHGGDGPHTWTRSTKGLVAEDAAPEGVTDELMEPLLRCLIPSEPFVEYGVVEYRFRGRFPDLFRAHVFDRGHVLTGKTVATASSVRFGVALYRLIRTGEVLSRHGPATGAWSYNGQVTYWAIPPEPGDEPISWASYCAKIGRSPEWTDEDHAAAV